MDDWVGRIVTALLSGGAVAAAFKGYKMLMDAKHRILRETRSDSIDVLMQEIDLLRGDRDELRKELRTLDKKHDADMSRLKDEHTKCLVDQGQMRVRVESLEQQLEQLRCNGNG